ncbi:hypothetical protein U9606_004941 [Vibrio harveyi]|uniref:hypothetical protein n=1 Tax=Vibrio harveyi TaxID=669 RepID=UPI00064690D4|nr:hypothetical protein [Vibrio harveyi]EMB9232133.1 hypothetical protein [Vibrio harveyi]
MKDYIAPFLTILGWGIVLYNTDRIALRNESRAAVDGCIKKLEEFIELAHEYIHDLSKEDVEDSVKYRFEGKSSSLLSSVETKSNYLFKRTKWKFIEDSQIVDIRSNAVSDKDKLEEAIEVAMDVIDLAEDKFSRRFSKKWYHCIPFWFRITAIVGIWCVIYFACGMYFIGKPFP